MKKVSIPELGEVLGNAIHQLYAIKKKKKKKLFMLSSKQHCNIKKANIFINIFFLF